MALILRMSVTKGLVAATGRSMDATFQRDRQVKARPRAADNDDSAGESQGTTREQAEEKIVVDQCSAIWLRSVGHNSWQGSLGENRTQNWCAETKTTTHLRRGCQRSKQTMRNALRQAANWLMLTEGRVVWETSDRRPACQKQNGAKRR
jgi:hypothetical protein